MSSPFCRGEHGVSHWPVVTRTVGAMPGFGSRSTPRACAGPWDTSGLPALSRPRAQRCWSHGHVLMHHQPPSPQRAISFPGRVGPSEKGIPVAALGGGVGKSPLRGEIEQPREEISHVTTQRHPQMDPKHLPHYTGSPGSRKGVLPFFPQRRKCDALCLSPLWV